MNHPDDDCTVITDMPLRDEVVGFIEKGLHRDMTEEDVENWCGNNLDGLASIYEKYRDTYLSYGQAEITLFFTQTVYGREDAMDIIGAFVDGL
jgi:hypothetical protein|tara:strand:- start:1008 stop:1286 length:279 start_codon:yes stop_codon:yes gene_type:complete